MWTEQAFDPDTFPTMILNDEKYALKRPLTDEEYINLTHEFVCSSGQMQPKFPLGTTNFGYQMRTSFTDTCDTRIHDYTSQDLRGQNYAAYENRHHSPPSYEVIFLTFICCSATQASEHATCCRCYTLCKCPISFSLFYKTIRIKRCFYTFCRASNAAQSNVSYKNL